MSLSCYNSSFVYYMMLILNYKLHCMKCLPNTSLLLSTYKVVTTSFKVQGQCLFMRVALSYELMQVVDDFK